MGRVVLARVACLFWDACLGARVCFAEPRKKIGGAAIRILLSRENYSDKPRKKLLSREKNWLAKFNYPGKLIMRGIFIFGIFGWEFFISGIFGFAFFVSDFIFAFRNLFSYF